MVEGDSSWGGPRCIDRQRLCLSKHSLQDQGPLRDETSIPDSTRLSRGREIRPRHPSKNEDIFEEHVPNNNTVGNTSVRRTASGQVRIEPSKPLRCTECDARCSQDVHHANNESELGWCRRTRKLQPAGPNSKPLGRCSLWKINLAQLWFRPCGVKTKSSQNQACRACDCQELRVGIKLYVEISTRGSIMFVRLSARRHPC